MPVFLLPTSSFLLFIDVCVQASSCFKLLWQLFTSYTHYICSFIKFQFVVLRDLKQFSIHYSTVFLFSAFFFLTACIINHAEPKKAGFSKGWCRNTCKSFVLIDMRMLIAHHSLVTGTVSLPFTLPAFFFFFFLLKQLFSWAACHPSLHFKCLIFFTFCMHIQSFVLWFILTNCLTEDEKGNL